MDILVATPCYDGRVYMQFAGALAIEQEIALKQGHRLVPGFLKGGALPTTSRNIVANDFLVTHMDRLVFVDADVSWKPGDLLKIALNPRPFVGGLHRKRQEEEDYPVFILPGKRGLAEDGCYEVAGMSFGFIAISRIVFERYEKEFKDRWQMRGNKRRSLFFHAPIAAQAEWGEDIAFCFDYRAAGGEVWIDTSITLNHHDGPCTFTGNFWEWLKKQQKEST